MRTAARKMCIIPSASSPVARLALLGALLSAPLAACDDPALERAEDDPIEFRDGPGDGGPIFNTNIFEGADIDAIDTLGHPLDGVRLSALSIDIGGLFFPMPVDRLHVDHGTLIGVLGNGPTVTISGLGFLHSRWTFLVNGAPVVATLETIETSLAAGLYDPLATSTIRELDPERLVYTFTYENSKQEILNTCGTDPVGGARMVIYGDLLVDESTGIVSERENTVYFGCLDGSMGKASLWGYAPDSPSLPSVSLSQFTLINRVIRADYCGDSVSYTKPGKPLILRDRLGIHEFPALPFTTEAVWAEGTGAVCLNRLRYNGVNLLAPHQCADGSFIPLCPAEAIVSAAWTGEAYGDVWTKLP